MKCGWPKNARLASVGVLATDRRGAQPISRRGGHAKTVPILAYGSRRRPKDRYECCEARELFELDFVRVTEDAEITGRQVGCFDQIAEHHVSGVPEELFLISTLAEKVEVEGF